MMQLCPPSPGAIRVPFAKLGPNLVPNPVQSDCIPFKLSPQLVSSFVRGNCSVQKTESKFPNSGLKHTCISALYPEAV